MGTVDEREISIEDIVRVLVKRWKLVLIPSLIAGILGVVYVYSTPKVYKSYALLKPGYIGNTPLETVAMTREVMDTLPSRTKILMLIKDVPEISNERDLKSRIKYEDAAGLIKISAIARSPKNAAKIVNAASAVLEERHQDLYDSGLVNLRRVIKFVRDSMNPTPISTGISEFKNQQTIVVVPAVPNFEPYRIRIRLVSLVAFFVTAFVCCIIAFYLEGRNL